MNNGVIKQENDMPGGGKNCLIENREALWVLRFESITTGS